MVHYMYQRSPDFSPGDYINLVGVIVAFLGALFSVVLAYLTLRRSVHPSISQCK